MARKFIKRRNLAGDSGSYFVNDVPRPTEAETCAGSGSDFDIEKKTASRYALMVLCIKNFVGSVLFHAHVAYFPLLIDPVLRRCPLFSGWSQNALTLLTVFAANAAWIEFLDMGCLTDACAAYVALKQEKQLRSLCGEQLKSETKCENFLATKPIRRAPS